MTPPSDHLVWGVHDMIDRVCEITKDAAQLACSPLLPGDAIRLEQSHVTFVNRQTGSLIEAELPTDMDQNQLGPDTYHLEREWRSWMGDGGLDAPKDADHAFLGFCRKWFEKRGRP